VKNSERRENGENESGYFEHRNTQDKALPHLKLPQYTVDEVERSIEAIQLLIKVRDRCRKQGLIQW
jgi:hypothetical protein